MGIPGILVFASRIKDDEFSADNYEKRIQQQFEDVTKDLDYSRKLRYRSPMSWMDIVYMNDLQELQSLEYENFTQKQSSETQQGNTSEAVEVDMFLCEFVENLSYGPKENGANMSHLIAEYLTGEPAEWYTKRYLCKMMEQIGSSYWNASLYKVSNDRLPEVFRPMSLETTFRFLVLHEFEGPKEPLPSNKLQDAWESCLDVSISGGECVERKQYELVMETKL